jgi:hypothetical protein
MVTEPWSTPLKLGKANEGVQKVSRGATRRVAASVNAAAIS